MNRRTFLRHSVLAGGFALANPLEAFWRRIEAGGHAAPQAQEYGPLVPTKDEITGLPLLELPEGFRYLSYGWTGDPLDGEIGRAHV